nr:MAG: hypothetical protein [Apis mellifera filamentous virus]
MSAAVSAATSSSSVVVAPNVEMVRLATSSVSTCCNSYPGNKLRLRILS